MSRTADFTPHVDAGELHAWLDGALDQLGETRATEVREHLRACSACRDALGAEEAVHARAAEVLALSAPRTTEAPPFEMLVERARAGEVRPVGRASRFARLGWAASVVIALGAGWMARELGLHPPAARDATNPAVTAEGAAEPTAATAALGPDAARMGESAGAAAEASPVASALADAAPDGVADTPVDALAGAASLTTAEARVARAAAAAPPMSRVAAADARASAGAGAGREAPSVRERVVNAAIPEAERPVIVRAEAPTIAELDVVAVAGAQAEAPAAETAEPLGFTAGASGERREVTRSAISSTVSAAPSALGIQQPSGGAGVPRLFTERAEVGSRTPAGTVDGTADPDEALDLTVPGLEVLRVEWSPVAPRQPSLRVLQRLPNGDTLEIRFVRAPVAGDDVDPLALLLAIPLGQGWSQVVKVHGDGWLVARAPLAREELDALVERAGTR